MANTPVPAGEKQVVKTAPEKVAAITDLLLDQLLARNQKATAKFANTDDCEHSQLLCEMQAQQSIVCVLHGLQNYDKVSSK